MPGHCLLCDEPLRDETTVHNNTDECIAALKTMIDEMGERLLALEIWRDDHLDLPH